MGWERKRGKLARVQPLSARRRARRVLRRRRATRRAAARRALRHHARLRHRAAARRGAARWSARWPIRSIAPSTTRRAGASSRATASCSRASASRSRARTARASPRSTRAIPGVDPYTTAVSDVYQDLFGEGTFTGKGIYDVDAFERATHGRFPENTLLSHDLIEGLRARRARHRHRALRRLSRRATSRTRGASTAGSAATGSCCPGSRRACPGPTGPSRTAVALSRAGRSSTTCGAASSRSRSSLLLVAGWTVLPGSRAALDALVLVAIASPVALSLAARRSSGRRRDKSLARLLRGRRARRRDQRSAIRARASSSCRTRRWCRPTPSSARSGALFVSRRHLLEWQTASQVERVMGTGSPREVWRRHVARRGARRRDRREHRRASRWGTGTWAPRLPRGHGAWPAADPMLYLLVTFRSSACGCESAIAISAERAGRAPPAAADRDRAVDRAAATRCCTGASSTASSARRRSGWRPTTSRRIRRRSSRTRTSPTNIGLQLLGDVSAYDLGFLPCGAMIERLERSSARWSGMERFRGHFYNWYELQRAADPRAGVHLDRGQRQPRGASAGAQAGLPRDRGRATRRRADLGGAVHRADNGGGGAAGRWRRRAPSTARASGKPCSRRQSACARCSRRCRRWRDGRARRRRSRVGRGRWVERPQLAPVRSRPHRRDARLSGAPRRHRRACRHSSTVCVRRSECSPSEEGGHHPPLRQVRRRIRMPATTASVAPPPASAPAGPTAPVDAGEGCRVAGPGWSRDDLAGLGTRTARAPRRGAGLDRRRPRSPSSASAAGGTRPRTLRERVRNRYTPPSSGAAGCDRGPRGDVCVGDGLQVPLRHPAQAVRHRVPGRGLRARSSYYDLLASEARLASFVAIAKNDVPVEHWFRLGRSLTTTAGATALISWSGSMFEYLMPVLVMKSFPFTLLDQTYAGAVRRQIAYGRERGVPWGVSESAYNARDRAPVYQYRAFGVPDLALKRGLSRDLVMAPYATLLALPVEPHRRCATWRRWRPRGARSLRIPRRGGLHTTAARITEGAGGRVHGAPHRHGARGAHQRDDPRPVAAPVPHRRRSCASAELVLFEQIPRRFVLQERRRASSKTGHGAAQRRSRSRPRARWTRRTRRSPASRSSGIRPTP